MWIRDLSPSYGKLIFLLFKETDEAIDWNMVELKSWRNDDGLIHPRSIAYWLDQEGALSLFYRIVATFSPHLLIEVLQVGLHRILRNMELAGNHSEGAAG